MLSSRADIHTCAIMKTTWKTQTRETNRYKNNIFIAPTRFALRGLCVWVTGCRDYWGHIRSCKTPWGQNMSPLMKNKLLSNSDNEVVTSALWPLVVWLDLLTNSASVAIMSLFMSTFPEDFILIMQNVSPGLKVKLPFFFTQVDLCNYLSHSHSAYCMWTETPQLIWDSDWQVCTFSLWCQECDLNVSIWGSDCIIIPSMNN